MCVFYRIWYDNRDINPTKFKKAFIDIVYEKRAYWDQYMKVGGMKGSQLFYNMLMEDLKAHRKRVNWKSDTDIIE